MAEGPVINESLEGWTKDEKYALLLGLKAHGSYDIEGIQDYVSTKTAQEIQMAINYYKEIASKHPVFKQKIMRFNRRCAPLISWEKLLIDNIPFKELRTETSTALRMIAELEKMPEPASVGNIDFRKIYHTMANAMEGKPLEVDQLTIAVLHKCIVETGLSSRAFLKASSCNNIINTTNLKDNEEHSFPKPTEDQELNELRHLASQKRYNPLRVPEMFLKPSCDKPENNEKGN